MDATTQTTRGEEVMVRVLCPCCEGKGYQKNKQTGINDVCPCCEGSGIYSLGPKIEAVLTTSGDNNAI